MATAKKPPKLSFRELLTIPEGEHAGDHHTIYWTIFGAWPKSLVRNNITIATKYREAILSGDVSPQQMNESVSAYLESTNYPCDLSRWMSEEGWRTFLN